MAKFYRNNILITVYPLYIFLLCVLIMFSSCETEMKKTNYHRYNVGRIRIENPVIIEFGEDNPDEMYVCPDSIAELYNQDKWKERVDVFPYILSRSSFDETEIDTHFNSRIRALAEIGDCCYNPIAVIYSLGEGDDKVTFYKFYYKLDVFDAYMQTYGDDYKKDNTTIEYDLECIHNHDHSSVQDESNSSSSNVKKAYLYRLAVRHHYSLWQIFKLRYKEWLLTMDVDEHIWVMYGDY